MTAANATSPWLFPGRASGQPMHTTSLRLRLHDLGIPNLTNRSRAIRELLRQAPAIIVAGMAIAPSAPRRSLPNTAPPGSTTPASNGSPAARPGSPSKELVTPVHVRAPACAR